MTVHFPRYLAYVFALTACAEPAARSTAAVIYGEDGRTEVYAHENAALVEVAEDAVAMMVAAALIDESDPDDVLIVHAETLGVDKNLCPGERFAEQRNPGSCSGTLIDSQHILTAGHCVDGPDDCGRFAWVLGYRYVEDGELVTLTSDDVYRCGEVAVVHDEGIYDYGVVRLTRPVVGHTPASLREGQDRLTRGTPVALIGHPSGLPMKIDSGGEMRPTDEPESVFYATVDAFSGNSGSGVFSLDGTLLGVLYANVPLDYVEDPERPGCQITNTVQVTPSTTGALVHYLHVPIAAFCQAPGVVFHQCDCDGAACVEGPSHDRCPDAEVIEPRSQMIRGALIRHTPWEYGTCGGHGREVIYTFTLTEDASFTASVAGFDTVMYLRQGACDGPEVECNDDVDAETNQGSRIHAELGAGTYFLFVDSEDAPGVSPYALTLEVTPHPTDAGSAPDAGTPTRSDAGRTEPISDAGVDEPAPSSGCSCRAVDGGAPGMGLGWLLLALARRRRR